ncbi:MAG: CHASE domain-containing protein, partial [Planctomycetia bacterium]
CSIAVGLFVYTSHSETRRIGDEFERHTGDLTESIRLRLGSALETLYHLRGLVAAAHPIDAERFEEFTGPELTTERVAQQSFSWNPKVGDAERAAFERSASTETNRSVEIFEFGPEGLRRAGRRPDYVVVRHVDPTSDGQAAVGYDVASEPANRSALRESARTGRAVGTAPVSLLQNEASKNSMLILAPVFRDRILPKDAEHREDAVAGFVATVLRLDKFVDEAWKTDLSDGVACVLADDTDEERPVPFLYWNQGSLGWSVDPSPSSDLAWLKRSHVIEAAGRRWKLRFTATRPFLQAHGSMHAWNVLASGVLFSTLLAAFLMAVTGRTFVVEDLVREGTAKLARITQALQSSGEVLRSTLSSLDDLLLVVDTDGVIQQYHRPPSAL